MYVSLETEKVLYFALYTLLLLLTECFPKIIFYVVTSVIDFRGGGGEV